MIRVEMKLKEPHRVPHRKMPLGPYMVTDEMQAFEISDENASLLVSDQAKYWMEIDLIDDNLPTQKVVKKKSSKNKV